jgi:hypothetical protein
MRTDLISFFGGAEGLFSSLLCAENAKKKINNAKSFNFIVKP